MFQQDGVTAHTARASMTVVRQMFPQHVVSRFGDVPWPPRSPDLSACDFFLWGYLKSNVYVRKPRTVDDLKVSIREEIATLPQEILVNVMQNFEERLRTCVRQGRHLSDITSRKWVIHVGNQNCIYYRLFWCWHNFFILKMNKVTIIWKTCVLFAPHCIIIYIFHYYTPQLFSWIAFIILDFKIYSTIYIFRLDTCTTVFNCTT